MDDPAYLAEARARPLTPAWWCLRLADAVRPRSHRWWVLLRFAAVHRLGADWRVGPQGEWRRGG